MGSKGPGAVASSRAGKRTPPHPQCRACRCPVLLDTQHPEMEVLTPALLLWPLRVSCELELGPMAPTRLSQASIRPSSSGPEGTLPTMAYGLGLCFLLCKGRGMASTGSLIPGDRSGSHLTGFAWGMVRTPRGTEEIRVRARESPVGMEGSHGHQSPPTLSHAPPPSARAGRRPRSGLLGPWESRWGLWAPPSPSRPAPPSTPGTTHLGQVPSLSEPRFPVLQSGQSKSGFWRIP